MQHSNTYIIGFAAIVTLVCSLLLSLASTALKPLQDEQKELFIKKNILKVFDLTIPENAESKDILKLYDDNVKTIFIDKEGTVVTAPENASKYNAEAEYKRFGLKYNQVNNLDEIANTSEYKKSPLKLAVYERVDSEGNVMYYAIPVFGKGLWSTVKAYLALEPDFNTIKGIAFYEHNETPGLGARVEEDWFQNNFKGKKIFSETGEFTSVTVKKGAVDTNNDVEARHYVDGISGATLTCKGVNEFTKKDLSLYLPFFEKMKASKVLNQQNDVTQLRTE